MNTRTVCVMWVCLVGLFVSPAGFGQMVVGTAFTYQGQLTDDGQPADGQYDFEFTLYDSMGFPMVNGVTIDDHQVRNGLFAVQLDFGDMFWGDAIQLEVAVRPGASTGAYTTLWPRQALTATPYALYALNAPGSSGLTLPFSQTVSSAVYQGVPAFRITDTVDESPAMWAATSGNDNYSVFAEATGDSSIGLYGFASGLNGCAIQANTAGSASTAISGWAMGSPPQGQQNTGGYFYAANDTGIGVYGEGKYGLHGKSMTWVGGTGVLGQAFVGSGTGVRGEADAANGTGVYGAASSSTGLNYGVQGQTSSSAGYGVYGYNSAEFDSAVAVYGAVNWYNSEAYGGYFEGNGYFESTLSVGGYVFADSGIDTLGTVGMSGFRLDSAPQAGHVLTSDASGYGTWQPPVGGGSLWQESGYDIFYNAGNVGIGVSSPDARLHVAGRVEMDGFTLTDSPVSGYVLTADDLGYGTWQPASSGISLPYSGSVSHSGAVLAVTNTGTEIGSYAIQATISNPLGHGDAAAGFFSASAANGMAIYAVSGGTPATARAYNSGSGEAFYGSSGAGGGGHFRSNAADTYGVKGTAVATTGNDTVGGWFETSSSSGKAVYALSTGMNAATISAESQGAEATTLYARAEGANATAIYGSSDSGQPCITASNSGSGDLFRGKNGGATMFRVQNNGHTEVTVLRITGGADLAERFDVGDVAKPGMVVEIDRENPGKLRLARGAYNRRVAGVVSGAKGVDAGMILADLPGDEDSQPVALSGRVWVYADATAAAIEPGDLLTTAERPGHAMAVTDHARAPGAVLGKAMSALAKGETGMVLVLVNLQ